MEEEKEKKGLKKDFKIKVTEFAEMPDDIVPKMIKQETLYSYPKGYVPPEEFEPKPVKEENWYELFNYPKVKVNVRTGEEVEEKQKPIFHLKVTDEDDYLEEELHKVYKFEVIFVNLGDDYSDDPKEEIQHFIEEGLNRWNCMNADVMISDVRERTIDWESKEAQEIYNRQDSTFKEWNKIFAQEDLLKDYYPPDFKKRIEQMRKEWDLDE